MWPQAMEIRRPPGPACGEALRNGAVGNGGEWKLRKQYSTAGGWGFHRTYCAHATAQTAAVLLHFLHGGSRGGECGTCGNLQGPQCDAQARKSDTSGNRTVPSGRLWSTPRALRVPQCDFENRLRSIPRHYPTATFPWGRRQWAQPSRVVYF